MSTAAPALPSHPYLLWPEAATSSSDSVYPPLHASKSAISDSPLDPVAMRRLVSDGKAGAILVFEGTVRSTARDRSDVIALEYEVKATMADKVIWGILAATARDIAIERVAVAHRQGRCELGEPTIVIAVAAGHRDEAYRASRILIDRIKHEAPIWKREIFSDGSGAWSEGCTACTHPGYHPPKASATHLHP
jgi:molybdopterin synthase catalytic subunit